MAIKIEAAQRLEAADNKLNEKNFPFPVSPKWMCHDETAGIVSTGAQTFKTFRKNLEALGYKLLGFEGDYGAASSVWEAPNGVKVVGAMHSVGGFGIHKLTKADKIDTNKLVPSKAGMS